MIFIEVIIPSPQYLRSDIKNWDTFGAAEALSNEMISFPAESFSFPNVSNLAVSAVNPQYGWVTRTGAAAQYPTINFYDDERNALLATIEGTPHYQGEVRDKLKTLITEGVTTATPQKKLRTASLWLLGLLLFAKMKTAK